MLFTCVFHVHIEHSLTICCCCYFLELKSIHFTKTKFPTIAKSILFTKKKFPTIAKNKIAPSLFTTSIDSSNSDVHVPPPPDQEYDDEGDGDPWGADGEFDAWGGGGGFDGADSQFAIR